MKKILLLIALSVSSVALAQDPFMVARPAGTPQVSGTPGVTTKAAVDKYGNLNVNIANGASGATNTVNVVATPGATSFLKAEDAPHASSDTGVLSLAVRNDSNTTAFTSTDGDNSPIAVNSRGSVMIDSAVMSNLAGSFTKAEDGPAASGDTLVGVAGVINTSLTSVAGNGDYAAPALSLNGAGLSSIIYDGVNFGDANTPVVREDSPIADVSAGMKALFQTQDPLSVDQSASGDAAHPKIDRAGRTITTLAPAGESWQACTSAIGTATNTTLKAAVASNRIYVTAYGCTNNGATAQLMQLTDGLGGTNMDLTVLPVATSTGPFFWKTFPVPLRGTSNTILGVTTSAASNTYCCASGYISVN